MNRPFDKYLRLRLTFAFLLLSFIVAMGQKPDTLKILKNETKFKSVRVDKSTIYQMVNDGQIKLIQVLGEDEYLIEPILGNLSNYRLQFNEIKANSQWKSSSALLLKIHSNRYPSQLIVKTSNISALKSWLHQNNIGFSIIREIREYQVIIIDLAKPEKIVEILNSDLVYFADIYSPNAKEETLNNFHDLSVNKINIVQCQFPDLKGNGLTISIKERAFDTTDIDLKGRAKLTELADDFVSLHANQMATMIGGGGSSALNSLGAAPEVNFTSSSYENFFPDPLSSFAEYQISVQNHSYGTEIQTFYGVEASAYDQFLNENPSILHVFSSGNAGQQIAEDGLYEGLLGFGNLTGNMKIAKNILLVGATQSLGTIDSRNSNGPANDGRIKPELMAYGAEGSSDAAAIASGAALLMQDAYKSKHGILPDAALVKAVLIAGADEIGNEGPEHQNGFGALNAYAGLKILDRSQFIGSEISQNAIQEFPISISSDLHQFRLTLVWNDPAANAGDNLALRNDLDLELVLPSGEVVQPWILSAYPHLDSLKKAPIRRQDRLNNVELITLNLPIAGDYLIRIKSSNLIGVTQQYWLAYKADSLNHFEWTYPLKNDALESDTEKVVRWESTFSGLGTLEISTNGQDWDLISNQVQLNKGFWEFNTPEVSNKALLRLTMGNTSFTTDTFSISPVASLQVGYNCPDDFMLTWPQWESATHYQLFALGEKYLEPVLSTTDTLAELNKTDFTQKHFMIIPWIDNVPAHRSYAYNYENQGVFCYFSSFFAITGSDVIELKINLSITSGVKGIKFLKWNELAFEEIESIDTHQSLSYTITDSNPKDGKNIYKALIILDSGEEHETDLAEVYYADESTYLVFPNPANGNEGVTILTDGKGLLFQLMNNQGKVLQEETLVTALQTFELKGLSQGIYFYKVLREGKNAKMGKLVIH